MDINEFLKGADISKMRGDFAEFQRMLNTPKGRAIKEKLGKLNKNQLKERFNSLNAGQMPQEGDISKFMSDPNLLKKINQLLDN